MSGNGVFSFWISGKSIRIDLKRLAPLILWNLADAVVGSSLSCISLCICKSAVSSPRRKVALVTSSSQNDRFSLLSWKRVFGEDISWLIYQLTASIIGAVNAGCRQTLTTKSKHTDTMNESNENLNTAAYKVNSIRERSKTAERRFLDKIDKNSSPIGCWKWMGNKNRKGYGIMRAKYTFFTTHRISWVLFRGPIPEKICVLHKCDNNPCCNPEHLFLGTITDNNRDCQKKGRTSKGDNHFSRRHPEKLKRGELNPNSKFTESQIQDMRKRRSNGEILQSIADDYNTERQVVGAIFLRKRWKHVP